MYTVIIFDYEAWMIFVYKDGKQIEYWSSAEDDWEQAWKTISYMNPKEEIEIKMKLYRDIIDLENTMDNKDWFNLTENDIEKLRQLTT